MLPLTVWHDISCSVLIYAWHMQPATLGWQSSVEPVLPSQDYFLIAEKQRAFSHMASCVQVLDPSIKLTMPPAPAEEENKEDVKPKHTPGILGQASCSVNMCLSHTAAASPVPCCVLSLTTALGKSSCRLPIILSVCCPAAGVEFWII